MSHLCCGREAASHSTHSVHLGPTALMMGFRGGVPHEPAMQKGPLEASSLQPHAGSQHLSPQQGSQETHHFQRSPALPGAHYAPHCARGWDGSCGSPHRQHRGQEPGSGAGCLVQPWFCHYETSLCLSFHLCNMRW